VYLCHHKYQKSHIPDFLPIWPKTSSVTEDVSVAIDGFSKNGNSRKCANLNFRAIAQMLKNYLQLLKMFWAQFLQIQILHFCCKCISRLFKAGTNSSFCA